jgi:hypothetical protein
MGVYYVRNRRIRWVFTIGVYDRLYTMVAYYTTFSIGVYRVGPVPYFHPVFSSYFEYYTGKNECLSWVFPTCEIREFGGCLPLVLTARVYTMGVYE